MENMRTLDPVAFDLASSPGVQAGMSLVMPEYGTAMGGVQFYSGLQTGNTADMVMGGINVLAGGLSMLKGGGLGNFANISSDLKILNNFENKAQIANDGWQNVGRWMSRRELNAMQKTGQVAEGAGGQTFVSINGPKDFMTQTDKGSIYVEYEVPRNSLLSGGREGWYKTIGPSASDAMKVALEKQGGSLLPNIEIYHQYFK